MFFLDRTAICFLSYLFFLLSLSLALFARGPRNRSHFFDNHGVKAVGGRGEKSIVKNLDPQTSLKRGNALFRRSAIHGERERGRDSRNYSKFEVARRLRLAFFIELVTRRPTDLLLGNNSEAPMNFLKHGQSRDTEMKTAFSLADGS